MSDNKYLILAHDGASSAVARSALAILVNKVLKFVLPVPATLKTFGMLIVVIALGKILVNKARKKKYGFAKNMFRKESGWMSTRGNWSF